MIVDYTPHSITIDTQNCKNTVIRINDILISTETTPKPTEPRHRLISFVACKTVGEYNRNKRKIRKFCLAEKPQARKEARSENAQDPDASVPSSAPTGPANPQQQQSTSTPIDNPGPSFFHSVTSSISISPINRLPRIQSTKKTTKKKSSRPDQKVTRESIRQNAII